MTDLLEAHTMPDDSLTLDEIRRMAAEIGMTRLTDQHLQELLRATRIARARRVDDPTRCTGCRLSETGYNYSMYISRECGHG